MNTNCALLVADSFCYEIDFKLFISGDTQTDCIRTLISASRYLDNLLI